MSWVGGARTGSCRSSSRSQSSANWQNHCTERQLRHEQWGIRQIIFQGSTELYRLLPVTAVDGWLQNVQEHLMSRRMMMSRRMHGMVLQSTLPIKEAQWIQLRLSKIFGIKQRNSCTNQDCTCNPDTLGKQTTSIAPTYGHVWWCPTFLAHIHVSAWPLVPMLSKSEIHAVMEEQARQKRKTSVNSWRTAAINKVIWNGISVADPIWGKLRFWPYSLKLLCSHLQRPCRWRLHSGSTCRWRLRSGGIIMLVYWTHQ